MIKENINIYNLKSMNDIRDISNDDLKRYLPGIEFEALDNTALALDIFSYVSLLWETFDEYNDFNFSNGSVLISQIYPRLVLLIRELFKLDEKLPFINNNLENSQEK